MKINILLVASVLSLSPGLAYAQTTEDPILTQYATDFGLSADEAKVQMDAMNEAIELQGVTSRFVRQTTISWT